MAELNILVVLKMVPDVVEELEVADDGASLDTEFLRLIVNEADEHALEQALILNDRFGGTVSVAALDTPDVDDVLYTAAAKGADRVVKITEVPEGLSTRGSASVLATVLPTIDGLLPADLVLTGCQAIDDLDGQIAPILAHELGLPYLGLVTGVDLDDVGRVTAVKEYSGGVRGAFRLELPALLGVQAAEKPPRYVPIAKVRAAMSSGEIEEVEAVGFETLPGPEVIEMTKPKVAEHAEMLKGDPEEIAGRIAGMLADRGLL